MRRSRARRLADISGWPVLVVFLAAGAAAGGLAFASVNLFGETMANLAFIRRHGVMAVEEGALLQLARLVLSGAVALVCYLAFKFCEVELSIRFRAWSLGSPPDGSDDA